ncbi:hypothetical protein CLU79DRAFT_763273, partial [Phycomyces nitens]
MYNVFISRFHSYTPVLFIYFFYFALSSGSLCHFHSFRELDSKTGSCLTIEERVRLCIVPFFLSFSFSFSFLIAISSSSLLPISIFFLAFV